MSAKKTGGLKVSARAKRYEERCARYREILAGHSLDAFPANLDTLANALGLRRWYPRPVPEGEEPTYWLYHAPFDDNEDTAEWRQHVFDEEYVVARRELVKNAFGRLRLEEQVCLALYHGLLDGIVPEKRTQYIANMLETGLDTVRLTRRRALMRLIRICEQVAWSAEPAPLDLSDPTKVGIEQLDFEVATYNCLKRVKTHTLSDLEKQTAEELMGLYGFGIKNLAEVCTKLKQIGRDVPLGAEDYLDVESL